jgi:uroporphyrinogen-III synthase
MNRPNNSTGHAPLAGVRILVGRAQHQASVLSAGLKKLGADVIEVPLIEIRKPRSYQPLDTAVKRIAEYDWLILTSVNGVESLSRRMKRLRIKRSRLAHLQIAAIGPATKNGVEKLGLKVGIVPKRYIAESVVESLRGKVKGKRVLLARAKVARDVIPRELRKMGARVEVVEAYKTVVPASSRKKLQAVMQDPKQRPHMVAFTSSSTVRNFIALVGGPSSIKPSSPHRGLQGIQFASIGPVSSATLREFGLPIHAEAREYTISGLIQAILSTKRVIPSESVEGEASIPHNQEPASLRRTNAGSE